MLWGLGLPLLVWHKYARLSRAYAYFALSFVIVSLVSQAVLGECVLTTLARHFWLASGGFRDRTPFTTLFVNTIAGFRPSDDAAALLWKVAVLVTSIGSISCWHATHPRRRGPDDAEAVSKSDPRGPRGSRHATG